MTIELTIRGETIRLQTRIGGPEGPDSQLTEPGSGLEHIGCARSLLQYQSVTWPWAVLLCRNCGLRILLPSHVQTLGDLALWATSHIS